MGSANPRLIRGKEVGVNVQVSVPRTKPHMKRLVNNNDDKADTRSETISINRITALRDKFKKLNTEMKERPPVENNDDEYNVISE